MIGGGGAGCVGVGESGVTGAGGDATDCTGGLVVFVPMPAGASVPRALHVTIPPMPTTAATSATLAHKGPRRWGEALDGEGTSAPERFSAGGASTVDARAVSESTRACDCSESPLSCSEGGAGGPATSMNDSLV